MKKFLSMAIILLATITAFAQDSVMVKPKPKKKNWSTVDLSNRANDHFMVMIGYDSWAGKPDTIRTGGLPRSFALYFMLDLPFKTDPRFSVGAGLGISASNIYFKKQEVLVAALNPTLAFPDEEASNYYKKYKLVSTYLDVPIELRFALDPEHTNSSWKFALGVKPGLLLSTYTKGKNLLNNAGQTLINETVKASSKKYFNGTRVAVTARISKGPVGLFGQFQPTPFIKSGLGPSIYPYSIGIVFSGL